MWNRFAKVPLLPLCAVGFFLGMYLCVRGKAQGALLAPAGLQALKGMTIDPGGLLYEILKIRFGAALLLLVAATTYLAPIVCGAFGLWFGMGSGVFLTTALLRYGLKGILLIPAGCFPHFLIYLPAFYMLLRWCEQLYGFIYLKREYKKSRISVAAKLVLILLALFAGIFLESYVAPAVLQGILKRF